MDAVKTNPGDALQTPPSKRNKRASSSSSRWVSSLQTVRPTSPKRGRILFASSAAEDNKGVQNSSTTSSSLEKPVTAVSGHRRPYRRTKRPKDYNGKSTITTITTLPATTVQPSHRAVVSHPLTAAATTLESHESTPSATNVFDTILHESQDLLLAAAQAQQLGRLKMAAAYLLLSHARLVGLGKRFDKCRPPVPIKHHTTNPPASRPMEEGEESVDGILKNVNDDKLNSKEYHHTDESDNIQMLDVSTPVRHSNLPTSPLSSALANSSSVLVTPKTKAARQLAQMLPSHVEMDQDMMEHLARAAAELHAARCRHSHGGTANPKPLVSTQQRDGYATATTNSSSNKNDTKLTSSTTTTLTTTFSIAWTDAEKSLLKKALSDGQDDPRVLAALTGRTEQQVKVFLRNQTERQRVQADLVLSTPLTELTSTVQTAGTSEMGAKNGVASANSSVGDSTSVPDNKNVSTTLLTPKRRGGRGRKPLTSAMSTVPNAICDARTLLQGKILSVVNNKQEMTDADGC